MNYLWKELVLILSYSKSKPNYTFSFIDSTFHKLPPYSGMRPFATGQEVLQRHTSQKNRYHLLLLQYPDYPACPVAPRGITGTGLQMVLGPAQLNVYPVKFMIMRSKVYPVELLRRSTRRDSTGVKNLTTN
jgi:hypothetical protein